MYSDICLLHNDNRCSMQSCYQLDGIAASLLPLDTLDSVASVFIKGDRNCLFHATTIALEASGVEKNETDVGSDTLRAICADELARTNIFMQKSSLSMQKYLHCNSESDMHACYTGIKYQQSLSAGDMTDFSVCQPFRKGTPARTAGN